MKNTKRTVFAQNIIAARKRLNWSQHDLAHRSGFHVNMIRRFETGKSEGSPESRAAIAQSLGCDVSDLYSDEADSVGLKLSDAAEIVETVLNKTELSPILIQVILALVLKDPSRVAGLVADSQFLKLMSK